MITLISSLLALALSPLGADLTVQRCPDYCTFYVANLGPDPVRVHVDIEHTNVDLTLAETFDRGLVLDTPQGYLWDVGEMASGEAAGIYLEYEFDDPCSASISAEARLMSEGWDPDGTNNVEYIEWFCAFIPLMVGDGG